MRSELKERAPVDKETVIPLTLQINVWKIKSSIWVLKYSDWSHNFAKKSKQERFEINFKKANSPT